MSVNKMAVRAELFANGFVPAKGRAFVKRAKVGATYRSGPKWTQGKKITHLVAVCDDKVIYQRGGDIGIGQTLTDAKKDRMHRIRVAYYTPVA